MSAELVIRKNIDTLLEVFERVKHQQGKRATRFRCWVDQKTGELSFIKEDQSGNIEGKNWKELYVNLFYDSSTKQVSFIESHPEALSFDPKAFRVFQETILGIKKLEAQQNYSINLVDYLLMNRIWYPVDRLAAEALLLRQPIGTYLFRKDEYASLLEDLLEKGDASFWTVSVVLAHHKCSDYTLVHRKGKWQIYNDDLSFQKRNFSSLSQLIANQKKLFRYPLYS